VTRLYMCTWDTTDVVYKMAAYQVNEGAQTISKIRDITTDPSAHQFRPWSPVGHGSDLSVLWIEGGYVTYLSYNTTVRYSA
jgi:hypothetical protein